MQALSEKGQSDFPCSRAIAQCCELRDRCFASANSSNTATQGWSWQPPLPASHHAPHSTRGQGPHGPPYASLHIPVFSLICSEGSEKNPPASIGCSGGHCLGLIIYLAWVCCHCLNICCWQEGSACAHPVPACTGASRAEKQQGCSSSWVAFSTALAEA